MARRRAAVLVGAAAGATLLAATVLLALPARPAKPGADRFPNVTLTTQDGEQVRFYDDLVRGKIVAINLIYTQCNYTCSLETARLAQVQDLLQDRMGKDIFFYSVSIDPDRDTPAELKAYAEKFKAGPGWTFLTGDRRDIDRLAVRLGLTENGSITSRLHDEQDGHTPHLLVGNDATGQWVRDSSTDNPRFLARLIGTFIDNGAHAPTGGVSSGGAPLKISSPGRYLFAKECAACHTIGHGDKIGPDLKDVVKIRDRTWLAHYIKAPDKMLAAGDPVAAALQAKYRATMPDLHVGDHDLAALLDFLGSVAAEGTEESPLADRHDDAYDADHARRAAAEPAKAP